MNETISSFADIMPFHEIIDTLKEQLEEEYPDELDRHWVPTAEDVTNRGSQTKRRSKKKKAKKQNLSTETVDESDLENNNSNMHGEAHDARSSDNHDMSREQTSTASPEREEADNSIDEIGDTQTNPEMDIEAEAETDSHPASSDVLVTDDDNDADRESEPEPEIADSDQEGRTRTRTRESDSEKDDDDEEDSDVDEQLASKVMLLRNA